MRSFFAALVLVLCVDVTVTKTTVAKLDVCDVLLNDAAQDACSMKKAFAGSIVYPQLLATFSPQGALYVHYTQIAHYSQVIVGGAQQLAPNRVALKPSLSLALIRGPLSIPGAQMLLKKYIVTCIDFNPRTHVARPIWLQSGMSVNPNTSELSSTTAPIIPYQAPNPQQGTGTHEYVFLLFEDTKAGLWATLRNNPKVRASLFGSFNLEAFRSQADLPNLVAGSFFKSVHA